VRPSSFAVVIVACASCAPAAPPSPVLLPTAFANAIAECGGTPLEPFPGVTPAVWASAPHALVFGRVKEVRFVEGPFARYLCGVGPEPDPVRADCDGTVEGALQVTLEDDAEVLRGDDVGVTFHLGPDLLFGFDPMPRPGPLGSIEWKTFTDSTGRIEPGQQLLMPAWRNDVHDVVGPAGTALALVDDDEIVRVQRHNQPECGWLAPADVDGQPLQNARELLAQDVVDDADIEKVEQFRAGNESAVTFGQDSHWVSQCYENNGECP
jgi:hypothetical protein